MKRICSDKHFSRLLRSFRKIIIRQIDDNICLNKNKELLNLIYSYFDSNAIECNSELLERKFRKNPHKTHSCIDDTIMHPLINKFWLSYTVEDSNHKRCKKTDDFNNKFLVFKLYLQVGNYRKKRIARWIVPMEWHCNN